MRSGRSLERDALINQSILLLAACLRALSR